MPELPEVQTIVSQLEPALRQAVVDAVAVHRASVIHHGRAGLKAGLVGKRIERIDREGKWIIFRLRPEAELVVHLGMSGRLTLAPRGAHLPKHTHLCIGFVKRTDELRFCDPRRFGGVWYFTADEFDDAARLRGLGPDALSIRETALRAICRRRRQIKALLLDQRAISGLGNIYADEALYATGIHPLAVASRLDDNQVRDLACSIRRVLRQAIRSRGSTLRDYRQADGSEGSFQIQHAVYGREGLACRRCGSTIQRIQAAGRSSHICPKCQRRKPVGRADKAAGREC